MTGTAIDGQSVTTADQFTIGELLNVAKLMRDEAEVFGPFHEERLVVVIRRFLKLEWSTAGVYLRVGNRDWFWGGATA